MAVRSTELNKMEQIYKTEKNSLLFFYGDPYCRKEELFQTFIKNKEFFYYRARVLDDDKQCRIFCNEVQKITNKNVDEVTYLCALRSHLEHTEGKVVIIIDEIQNMIKKDVSLFAASLKVIKQMDKKVLFVFGSSSIHWMEKELPDLYPALLRSASGIIKAKELSFLDVVRSFPDYTTSQCVEVYGILGGVPSFVERWDKNEDVRTNICRNILNVDGFLHKAAQQCLSEQLRELSVYNVILLSLANGNEKLNDLFKDTGYSRAKISVYLKNLMEIDVIEKKVSFDTAGWENTKKGVYCIKNHFLHFWFTFVEPHLSELYILDPEEFYDRYIKEHLKDYLKEYFRAVCMEYMELLNMVGKLPVTIYKKGTWIGKRGTIDIVIQDKERNYIVGICNWTDHALSYTMCEALFDNMKMAHIKTEHIFLFSAKGFDEKIQNAAKEDCGYVLIDMNEL